MVTKISLILAMLFSFAAFAVQPVCTLNLKPAGIYYVQCPRTMVAQGTDVYHSGPSPYPQVRVLCATPEIICNDVKKDLPKEKI